MENETNEICDFLVVGSGVAALSGALRAAVGGLSVTVVEKSAYLGGTSAMSGAGLWIPANHVARAEGVEDSEAEALAYLRASAPDGWAESEDTLWQGFARNAPKALAFIDDHTPLEFIVTKEPDPFSEYDGGKVYGRQLTVRPLSRRLIGRFAQRLRRSTLVHLFNYDEMVSLDPYHHPIRVGLRLLPKLIWRFLTGTRGQGNALMTGLIRGCLDHGVSFHLKTAAHSLIQDEIGRVVGAEIEQDGQRRTVRARRGVLLATGGFEWDEALRKQHFAGPVNFLGSPASNTGDGQKMAHAAGAKLDRMDQANIYPCLPTRYEGRMTGLPFTFTAEKHSILVNRDAKRFVNENDFNIGERMSEMDPGTGEPVHLPVWLIGDRRFLEQSLPFRWFARKQKGFVTRAGSLAELAAKTGLSAETLTETVARFNRFCADGGDLDFQRGRTAWDDYKSHGAKTKLTAIDQPPFVAVSVNRSILGTKGGARTNDRAQVLREDGRRAGGALCGGPCHGEPDRHAGHRRGHDFGPQHDLGLRRGRIGPGAEHLERRALIRTRLGRLFRVFGKAVGARRCWKHRKRWVTRSESTEKPPTVALSPSRVRRRSLPMRRIAGRPAPARLGDKPIPTASELRHDAPESLAG